MSVSSKAGCRAGSAAGYELFEDVNSYAKAFGELVEHRRHTPSLAAEEVDALIASKANIRILDVRRFDEYATMNIPGSISVPGARTGAARRPRRAGSRDHHHRQLRRPHPLDHRHPVADQCRRAQQGAWRCATARSAGRWPGKASSTAPSGAARSAPSEGGEANARDVAYRAGVRHIGAAEMAALQAQAARTLYRFDVRSDEEYTAGHLAGFRHYPGGQLVQETDMAAPVRGARIVLTDDRGVRADMTASWLAQMGWEIYVLEGGYDGALEAGPPHVISEARSIPPLPPSL